MSLAVPADAGNLDLLRDQLAPGASDDELRYFGAVCTRLDLDPFAGHLVLIGRYDKRVGKDVYRPQITVAGRRTIAARTGELVGIVGPVWCDKGENGRALREGGVGPIIWSEVWDGEGPYPYASRCLVARKGWDHAANGTAKWSEFCQYEGQVDQKTGERRVAHMWRQMPSHMLGKVAESLALRRAFPEISEAVGGLAGEEDVAAVAEASAVAMAAPPVPVAARPGPTPGPGHRPRRDEVPLEVYDSLPEAQGHDH